MTAPLCLEFQTTLARIIAQQCKMSQNTRFVQLSATTSGIADVKECVKIAKNEWKLTKKKTILFIDMDARRIFADPTLILL